MTRRLIVRACALVIPLFVAASPSMAQTTSTGESESVLWTCTGAPCPWGSTDSSNALVWPQNSAATSIRHGYVTSRPVYLPASAANGAVVEIERGSATAYAGAPLAGNHRLLMSLSAGESVTIAGLADGEVLSVQSDAAFSYRVALPAATPMTATPTTATPAISPPVSTNPAPVTVAPREGSVIESTPTEWRCDFPGCPGNWRSHTIVWPSWSAYSDNARAGGNFRRTYGPDGEVIHPYMGKWAHGCRVTAVSGVVLIIEWQRGSETWRETYLDRNETYRIDLTPPFDGAMIESFDDSPGFSVKLKKCKPQPLR